jgi:hypothetical protein
MFVDLIIMKRTRLDFNIGQKDGEFIIIDRRLQQRMHPKVAVGLVTRWNVLYRWGNPKITILIQIQNDFFTSTQSIG